MGEAVRVLGERLSLSRAFYAELEHGDQVYWVVRREYHRPGVVAHTQRQRAGAFGAEPSGRLHEGYTAVVDDVAALPLTDLERSAYAAIALEAYIVVPLIRAGKLVAVVGGDQTIPAPVDPSRSLAGRRSCRKDMGGGRAGSGRGRPPRQRREVP